MQLRDIAHSRTGDKGRIVCISLIAYREEDYERLERVVTPDLVATVFGALLTHLPRRYCVPNLWALNFVLTRPASESVTGSLALDAHGKGLGSLLLDTEIGPG